MSVEWKVSDIRDIHGFIKERDEVQSFLDKVEDSGWQLRANTEKDDSLLNSWYLTLNIGSNLHMLIRQALKDRVTKLDTVIHEWYKVLPDDDKEEDNDDTC